jgi:hypothetical protein
LLAPTPSESNSELKPRSPQRKEEAAEPGQAEISCDLPTSAAATVWCRAEAKWSLEGRLYRESPLRPKDGNKCSKDIKRQMKRGRRKDEDWKKEKGKSRKNGKKSGREEKDKRINKMRKEKREKKLRKEKMKVKETHNGLSFQSGANLHVSG